MTRYDAIGQLMEIHFNYCEDENPIATLPSFLKTMGYTEEADYFESHLNN